MKSGMDVGRNEKKKLGYEDMDSIVVVMYANDKTITESTR
jgi:hypothetical protein